MFEILGGILTDLSLIAGLVLIGMSFLGKYKKHRTVFIATGIILLAIGIAFLDVDALIEGFNRGRESAQDL